MNRLMLVVDDQKLIVKGIRFSLEQDDMDVDCVNDGEEALKLARENHYDTILLDVMLPKLDGFEVCLQIREFSDLAWWEELDRKCRACGEFPAVANFTQTDLWHFPAFVMTVLLMMQERQDVKTLFRIPVFSGEIGKRVFQILDTFGDRMDAADFPLAGAVNLDIGSWFALQARPKFHVPGDSYRIVPLKCGGHKILKYTAIALRTFVNASISDNEKKRVWEFLKHLLSRDVQKEITAMSGAISFCAEMKPEDHSWVSREDYLHFFPREGDHLVSTFLLPSERVAVLSALYEQYRHFGSDPEMIRRVMDAKLLTLSNNLTQMP